MQVKNRFFVDFRSVDSELLIRNSAILNMFEDIACLHGERIGDTIHNSDLRWLLTGYRVSIIRRPVYGQEVEVTTWSKDYRGVTATREFELRDDSGELMITGWSGWARVNIRTKELVRVTDENMAAYESEPERTNFGKPARINEPAEKQLLSSMLIDWRWMDTNRHVHNSYYLDLAEHVLPENIRAQISGCDFDIAYKQEIPENTTVCYLLTEDENGWTVTVKNEDQSVLHAVVIFRRKQEAASDCSNSCSESIPESRSFLSRLLGRKKND